MATRTGTAPGTSASRKAQRSTRLTVAVVLVLLAALAVIATAPTGSWLLVTLAGLLAVVLGAVAVRITHAELLATRAQAGRERVGLAQSYRRLAEDRVAENSAFLAHVQATAATREQALTELETALLEAQRRAAQARTEADTQARRAATAEAGVQELTVRLQSAAPAAYFTAPADPATSTHPTDTADTADSANSGDRVEELTGRLAEAETDVADLGRRLADAESRATTARIRVAELEQEIDVVRSELDVVTVAWHDAENARRHA